MEGSGPAHDASEGALTWAPPVDGAIVGDDAPPVPPRPSGGSNPLAPSTRGAAWPGEDGWWPPNEDSSTDVPPPLSFGQPTRRSPQDRIDEDAESVAELLSPMTTHAPGRVLALVVVLALVSLVLVALAMHPWSHDPPPPSRDACAAAPTNC